jgi:hypothetical protein
LVPSLLILDCRLQVVLRRLVQLHREGLPQEGLLLRREGLQEDLLLLHQGDLLPLRREDLLLLRWKDFLLLRRVVCA